MWFLNIACTVSQKQIIGDKFMITHNKKRKQNTNRTKSLKKSAINIMIKKKRKIAK